MNIRVIGPGCASCKRLFDLTVQAAQELGMKDEVEYSTDVQEIVSMGLMRSPVLSINGKAAVVGMVPDVATLKRLLSEETSQSDTVERAPASGGCSCGGSC